MPSDEAEVPRAGGLGTPQSSFPHQRQYVQLPSPVQAPRSSKTMGASCEEDLGFQGSQRSRLPQRSEAGQRAHILLWGQGKLTGGLTACP